MKKRKLCELSLNQIMWIILIVKFYKILLKGKKQTNKNQKTVWEVFRIPC